ncbi:uncharacterized protein LOC127241453 isoform X2 [Andrographis paniculata]|uniref:uncharacterized protein LOC127241453 isoform X2 n=1 Tax=Andrographis paniculata TaxID=175694 RepID=UPI0021E80B63|nr:uncharacterized protein LOC127241453 isoform X2 [Andrographis paniculata]
MEGLDVDMDAPLSEAFKRKRKTRKNESLAAAEKSTEAVNNHQVALNLKTDIPDGVLVSEFNYSVESHFKDMDIISKLCGYPETTLNFDHPEIKRISSSTTFLREWRDFKYPPRDVRFVCQSNSNDKEVMGAVTLPQFSSASVPKETCVGGRAGTESRDFVMHVGGAVWALDWCPRVEHTSNNHIKAEFIAVAAHPPESSYHKIGAPLTGRGAIQIWCMLTDSVKEMVPYQECKKSRSNGKKKGAGKSNQSSEPPRPRGRPRKKPNNDSVKKIDTNSLNEQPLAIEYPESPATFFSPGKKDTGKSNQSAKIPRPRGRPRKKPNNDSVEKIDTNILNAQTLATENPEGPAILLSPDETSGNACENIDNEDYLRTPKELNCTEHSNMLLLTAPEDEHNKIEAGNEAQVHNNGTQNLRQCELGEDVVVNQTCSSITVDSMNPENNVTCTSTFSNHIPVEVELPRMMLCLAHNGKVAWDVKWRPVKSQDSESKNVMGYLAVLLGNGSLEVWEVPFPHVLKHIFPVGKEQCDPRFVKLKPVFKCSKLKCGNRQSIPLTVEWSVLSSNDMILAGCHDGVVVLWKFSVTDSLTETKPLLSFSADSGPIRTLAWAPVPSDSGSANVIITAGRKGFKFWDIRDPFRPLWDYPIQGYTFGLDWLPDPRCVFGSTDDGALWLLSLARAACDIPITGKSFTVSPKQGFHIFLCSSFSIWNVQASRLTGMVAYCGEEGSTFCFKPTTKSVRDPSRNRTDHYLCGSMLEEGSVLVVATPSSNSSYHKKSPNLKRAGTTKDFDKRIKQLMDNAQTRDEPTQAKCSGRGLIEHCGSDSSSAAAEQKVKKSSKNKMKVDQENPSCTNEEADGDTEMEAFPPKNVAMHRVRWNPNKGSEQWLCYGGAAGLVRCRGLDFSVFQ